MTSYSAILGAGVTGLAAGMDSGVPVLEQSDGPGGICRSYYMRPGEEARLDHAPPADDAYRFEVGGGHWIFGGDPGILGFLDALAPLRVYGRRAAVRIGDLGVTIPYPLQHHVERLPSTLARQIAREQSEIPSGEPATVRDWLEQSFGPTLCKLFFVPFNDRYTAGLCDLIAPQDGYKSPSRLAFGSGRAGYNAEFRYPDGGLDRLAAAMSERCDVVYGRKLVGIDSGGRSLWFSDGSEQAYESVVSTLPLHQAVEMAGVETGEAADPFTSVLVLNIGAARGPACPDVHWQYEPDALSGFHRLGFYSGVDASFLPRAYRASRSHVSLYVERAYRGGDMPGAAELARYTRSVVEELQGRGYVEAVDVVDPSWVDMAYTWRSPRSRWRELALAGLARHGIHQVGRYAAWHFQGIADSVRDGLATSVHAPV
jgi:protoporphyrinogen oxidase